MKNEGTNYSLAKETKNILQKHNIHLNRKLGQNYLIDDFKKNKRTEKRVERESLSTWDRTDQVIGSDN